MGSERYLRDCYDLCDSRGLFQEFADGEESQDAREARKKDCERTGNLSDISKTLYQALRKNDALVSGINFGTHRLVQATNDTELPERPVASVLRRPDTDVEEAVVSARLDSAFHLEKVLADSLKHINLAILRSNIDSPKTTQKPTVQEPTVFYRYSNKRSQALYDIHLGLFSQRGLLDHDFNEPLEYEFRAHVDGVTVISDPHDKRGIFKSPYISLTTDPGRALKIGKLKITHAPDSAFPHEVYQIDVAKLRRMKIDIEPTTDRADRWHIDYSCDAKNRLPNVTGSHWVAKFWIPAECIIGKLPFEDFEALCKESGIIYDDKTYQATLGRDLPTGDFRRKCESLQPSPPPPIPVEIVADYDDVTTPSVTRPRRRIVQRSNPTDVNDDKGGEASTPPQNTAPADSGLEQNLLALSMNDT